MKLDVLSPWGMAFIPLYLAGILLISMASRRRAASSNDYLNASRSLPTWAAMLSFLAYNCGSIEVIGMSAMASQYGVQALHFYWIGGIPGMIFFAIVILPVYMRTGARSLPEYLEIRFGPSVRLLNACISMVGTACLAGAALYAMAHVLHVILGCDMLLGSLASALVVLTYVLLGGIRTTIYTSVFQLFVMITGLVPLLIMTFHFSPTTFVQRPERWHLWQSLPLFAPHATLDRVGVVLGLGFMLSFSYWCTDFVIIQRALTARSAEGARKVPILAGFGKLVIALIVVLPGVAAPALLQGTHAVPHDEAMPALLSLVYGQTLLGLGIAALLASLMAGFAGNVSGFAAAWTQEIYRNRICVNRSEQHYICMGRWAVLACFILSGLAAYITMYFRDLMEFLQLILSLFYAPLLAVVLAGMFSRRTREQVAFAGILLGVLAGIGLQVCARFGGIYFGSQMSANFYTAILSFIVTTLICLSPGRQGGAAPVLERPGSIYSEGTARALRPTPMLVIWSTLLLTACLALNLLWW
jgi:SSS family solute:Na+ symporter